jgi:hypothetical protein
MWFRKNFVLVFAQICFVVFILLLFGFIINFIFYFYFTTLLSKHNCKHVTSNQGCRGG